MSKLRWINVIGAGRDSPKDRVWHLCLCCCCSNSDLGIVFVFNNQKLARARPPADLHPDAPNNAS